MASKSGYSFWAKLFSEPIKKMNNNSFFIGVIYGTLPNTMPKVRTDCIQAKFNEKINVCLNEIYGETL
jgi:hypothetical protein